MQDSFSFFHLVPGGDIDRDTGWDRAVENADVLGTMSAATAEARTAALNAGVTRRPPPAGSTGASGAIVTGSGRGDEVSNDFRVPADCQRQVLTYTGTPIDRERSVAFVSFSVYDTEGDSADWSIGPANLFDAGDGSGMWSLDRGTYTIEVSSFNSTWSYEVKCR